MSTAILKNEIAKALGKINDKPFLEGLYTIINAHAEFGVSEEDWKIVEARSRRYKVGKAKGITFGEMRKRITKKLSA